MLCLPYSAEVLAREIRSQLLGHECSRNDLTLGRPARSSPPTPEPVAPVPSRYLDLIGDHSDHLGKGQISRRRKIDDLQGENRLLIQVPE